MRPTAPVERTAPSTGATHATGSVAGTAPTHGVTFGAVFTSAAPVAYSHASLSSSSAITRPAHLGQSYVTSLNTTPSSGPVASTYLSALQAQQQQQHAIAAGQTQSAVQFSSAAPRTQGLGAPIFGGTAGAYASTVSGGSALVSHGTNQWGTGAASSAAYSQALSHLAQTQVSQGQPQSQSAMSQHAARLQQNALQQQLHQQLHQQQAQQQQPQQQQQQQQQLSQQQLQQFQMQQQLQQQIQLQMQLQGQVSASGARFSSPTNAPASAMSAIGSRLANLSQPQAAVGPLQQQQQLQQQQPQQQFSALGSMPSQTSSAMGSTLDSANASLPALGSLQTSMAALPTTANSVNGIPTVLTADALARALKMAQEHVRAASKRRRTKDVKPRPEGNIRIPIWNRTEQRKVSGFASPMLKNLQNYLAQHPDCEVYDKDEHRATADPVSAHAVAAAHAASTHSTLLHGAAPLGALLSTPYSTAAPAGSVQYNHITPAPAPAARAGARRGRPVGSVSRYSSDDDEPLGASRYPRYQLSALTARQRMTLDAQRAAAAVDSDVAGIEGDLPIDGDGDDGTTSNVGEELTTADVTRGVKRPAMDLGRVVGKRGGWRGRGRGRGGRGGRGGSVASVGPTQALVAVDDAVNQAGSGGEQDDEDGSDDSGDDAASANVSALYPLGGNGGGSLGVGLNRRSPTNSTDTGSTEQSRSPSPTAAVSAAAGGSGSALLTTLSAPLTRQDSPPPGAPAPAIGVVSALGGRLGARGHAALGPQAVAAAGAALGTGGHYATGGESPHGGLDPASVQSNALSGRTSAGPNAANRFNGQNAVTSMRHRHASPPGSFAVPGSLGVPASRFLAAPRIATISPFGAAGPSAGLAASVAARNTSAMGSSAPLAAGAMLSSFALGAAAAAPPASVGSVGGGGIGSNGAGVMGIGTSPRGVAPSLGLTPASAGGMSGVAASNRVSVGVLTTSPAGPGAAFGRGGLPVGLPTRPPGGAHAGFSALGASPAGPAAVGSGPGGLAGLGLGNTPVGSSAVSGNNTYRIGLTPNSLPGSANSVSGRPGSANSGGGLPPPGMSHAQHYQLQQQQQHQRRQQSLHGMQLSQLSSVEVSLASNGSSAGTLSSSAVEAALGSHSGLALSPLPGSAVSATTASASSMAALGLGGRLGPTPPHSGPASPFPSPTPGQIGSAHGHSMNHAADNVSTLPAPPQTLGNGETPSRLGMASQGPVSLPMSAAGTGHTSTVTTPGVPFSSAVPAKLTGTQSSTGAPPSSTGGDGESKSATA